MASALEQYKVWKSQKNQIVGQLLQEISLSVNMATEMTDAFTADEIKRFQEFDEFLVELRSSYPDSGSPVLPLQVEEVSSSKGRKPIQRNYTDETPQCSATTGKGDRCTFPSVAGTNLCSKHTPKE